MKNIVKYPSGRVVEFERDDETGNFLGKKILVDGAIQPGVMVDASNPDSGIKLDAEMPQFKPVSSEAKFSEN